MKETITELIKKQERTMNDETKEKQELKVERRYLSMNVEARDGEEGAGKTVEGYAAVFNTDADLEALWRPLSQELLMRPWQIPSWMWQRSSIMTRIRSWPAIAG